MRGVTAAPALASDAAMLLPDPVTSAPTAWDWSSAGVKLMPVSGLVRLTTGAPTACTIVSGVVSVRPDPFAPAVPTARDDLLLLVGPGVDPDRVAGEEARDAGDAQDRRSGRRLDVLVPGPDPVGTRDVGGHPRRVVEARRVPAGGRGRGDAREGLPGPVRDDPGAVELGDGDEAAGASAVERRDRDDVRARDEQRLDVGDLRRLPGVVGAGRGRHLRAVDEGGVAVIRVHAQHRAGQRGRIGHRRRSCGGRSGRAA